MKKILLTLSALLVSAAAMSLMAQQSSFQPTVENGVFTLVSGSGSSSGVSKVEIYNDNGELVKEVDMVANGEKEIQCGDLASGQYHVMIHMNGQEYYSPLQIHNNHEPVGTTDQVATSKPE